MRDRETLEPAREEAARVCDLLLAHGFIVQAASERQNVLKVKPPLVLTEVDARRFVAALDAVLSALRRCAAARSAPRPPRRRAASPPPLRRRIGVAFCGIDEAVAADCDTDSARSRGLRHRFRFGGLARPGIRGVPASMALLVRASRRRS